MAHTATSPMGRVLEAIWLTMEKYQPFIDFFNGSYQGTPHKYKVYDGSIMPAGDVMANECPALVLEPRGDSSFPLTNLQGIGNGDVVTQEADWSLIIWGYMNTLKYDDINQFYQIVMAALYSGADQLFADPVNGILQGSNQIVQAMNGDWAIPGALWINPSDIENSNNTPSISFFAHQFTLRLTRIF